jgi:transposase
LVFRSGRAQFEGFVRERLFAGDIELNPLCRSLFASLVTEYEAITSRLEEIDQDLEAFAKASAVCRALLAVPGVGVIVATALFSAIANISDFKTGRDLAAFLGLVPRQRSTGGKTVLLGISKRGNTYVRTLLIHGMRSAFYHRQKRDDRMTDFMERLSARGLHTNKIVVASANKAARIIWAILSKDTHYQSRPV